MIGFDIHDEENGDTLEFPMALRAFSSDTLSMSDVGLCSSIKPIPPDSSNIFYKNTLEVIPNPSAIFGVGLPVVFYYVEVYNSTHRSELREDNWRWQLSR